MKRPFSPGDRVQYHNHKDKAPAPIFAEVVFAFRRRGELWLLVNKSDAHGPMCPTRADRWVHAEDHAQLSFFTHKLVRHSDSVPARPLAVEGERHSRDLWGDVVDLESADERLRESAARFRDLPNGRHDRRPLCPDCGARKAAVGHDICRQCLDGEA